MAVLFPAPARPVTNITNCSFASTSLNFSTSHFFMLFFCFIIEFIIIHCKTWHNIWIFIPALIQSSQQKWTTNDCISNILNLI
jgi:hypothetical protein